MSSLSIPLIPESDARDHCVICEGVQTIHGLPCPECRPESVVYFVEAIDHRSNIELSYQSPSAAAIAAWLAAKGFRWREDRFLLEDFHRKWLIARIRFGGDLLSAQEQVDFIFPWLPAPQAILANATAPV
jgi:hypothetical protein